MFQGNVCGTGGAIYANKIEITGSPILELNEGWDGVAIFTNNINISGSPKFLNNSGGNGAAIYATEDVIISGNAAITFSPIFPKSTEDSKVPLTSPFNKHILSLPYKDIVNDVAFREVFNELIK